MASVEPHPGSPVSPADLLTVPKWTDTSELKGKVAELRLELNSGGKKDKNHSAKKIALKKIVANMTMSNNDMVALFPDVVGCMQIPSLEIKKMYAASRTAYLVSIQLTIDQVFPILGQLCPNEARGCIEGVTDPCACNVSSTRCVYCSN